jgi:hypothetical protein
VINRPFATYLPADDCSGERSTEASRAYWVGGRGRRLGGTAALTLSLKTLDIHAGDEVICRRMQVATPPRRSGRSAVPVLCDVGDEDSVAGR